MLHVTLRKTQLGHFRGQRIVYKYKGDKTKRIKVEWERNRGKRWFTKGLRMMDEMRGKNETLHSLYICFTFGLDLNGVWRVLLYIGAENVMFWAVLTAVWGISWASGRVWLLMWVLYRLDMEMNADGALNGLFEWWLNEGGCGCGHAFYFACFLLFMLVNSSK